MKIVFLDRDGTLIEEVDDGKIDRLSKLAFKPDVFEALRSLKEHGYELALVTNQDGIGRNGFTWESFQEVQDVFLNELEKHGIRFFDIFICPHLKEDGCDCRKPEIGLVKDFIWECEMEAEDSWMIGDRPTDIEFGKNIGVRSLFLKTDRFALPEEFQKDPEVIEVNALLEAVERILSTSTAVS